MPRPALDLTGQRFSRLVALSRVTNDPNALVDRVRWMCRCDCGELAIVNTTYLRDGSTRSCGCLRKEKYAEMMARRAA